MNTSLSQLDATLAKINQPGTGTLAELDKTAVKIGDIAVTAQIQVRQTGALIAATSRTLDSAAADMHTTAQAFAGTAQAATAARAGTRSTRTGREARWTRCDGRKPASGSADMGRVELGSRSQIRADMGQ